MMDLFGQFGHKLKKIDELQAVIGQFPRDKKVIMCHGVFDIVHPGHVRHLLHAKSKADILIASTTADIHITKGKHRPHIPQTLRALNLAAFAAIDYVIIDENPTPIENIKKLQPDYFAKGYEYVANGMPSKTSEESAVLETYGGEIVFTPGDYVYSSSKFINMALPDVKMEKLAILMRAENVTFADLYEVVKSFAKYRVHVVGDTIVDSYTQASMIGGQTKTPTMSVLYEGRKDYVGGAAIVAKHLRAAGADVVFSTVLGKDSLQKFVLADLKSFGVDCYAIVDETRPTTNKNAIVVNGYRLLKIDMLDNSSISDHILHDISKKLRDVSCDAVIFSDFRHGIFNTRTIPELTAAIQPGTFKVADSQVASRWGNITQFKGFDLITPNEREARFSLADQDSGIRALALELYNKAQCNSLILKLGERGLIASRSEEKYSSDSFFVLDSFVDRLVDAVGSGDALLAYATLTMLHTKSEAMATIIGSVAAACECELDGNIPISPDLVIKKMRSLERKMAYEPEENMVLYHKASEAVCEQLS